MQQNLLGYLVGALEPRERQQVEDALAGDVQLRHQLDLMERSLEPVRADRGHYDPPAGLAVRTCQFVFERAEAIPAALSPVMPWERAGSAARWTMSDLAVAAGIFVAASLLFFPAINSSRVHAQLAACQNNLRNLGVALTDFSHRHDGYFPIVPQQGKLSFGGMYAPTLVDQEYVTDPQVFICPADVKFSQQEKSRFHVPTLAQIEAAAGQQLRDVQARMGGSYGFTLGHMDGREYRGTKNLRRENFAVLSDAPHEDGTKTRNHGGCGQNVWMEDGRVVYLTSCRLDDRDDNLFRNVRGEVGPGLHRDDSVITTQAMLVNYAE